MAAKPRLAIIGAGGIALSHYQGYRAAGAEIVAISDVNEAILKKRQQEWDIPFASTNSQEIFDREDIDGVSICTPNSFHAPLVIAAAKAKKHILCEKPISMSLAEAQNMIDVCNEEGVILQIGHHLRSANGPSKAKEILSSGALGDLMFIRLRQAHDWGGDGKVRGVFGLKQYSGGGTMLDNGCHMMDLIRYFAGDVSEIFARTATLKFSDIDVEDTSLASLRFRNGALGSVENAWTATGWEEGFVIFGSQGALEFSNRNGPPTLIHRHRQSPNTTWNTTDVAEYRFHENDGHQIQAYNFLDAMAGKRPVICSGEDGLEAIRLVLKGYESAEANAALAL